jgi:hypothetical protein
MNYLEIKATVIGPVEAVDEGCSMQVTGPEGVCASCGAMLGGSIVAVDNTVIVEFTPG